MYAFHDIASKAAKTCKSTLTDALLIYFYCTMHLVDIHLNVKTFGLFLFLYADLNLTILC